MLTYQCVHSLRPPCAPATARDRMQVPMLTQQSEEVAYATTGYLTACITQISSPSFLRGVAGFLLGPPVDSGSDRVVSPTAREASERMHTLLVQRCDDISDELSAATLLLFLRLLLKRDYFVLDALVLRFASTSTAPPTTHLQAAMQAMADKFTSELPENLRTDDVDVSYKEYFVDAQKAVLDARHTAALFGGVGLVRKDGGASAVAAATGLTYTHDDDDDEGPSFDDGGDGGDSGEGKGGDGSGVDAHVDASAPATLSQCGDVSQTSDSSAATEGAAAGVGVAVSCPCESPFLNVLSRRLRQLPNQPYSLNLLVTANYAALLE